MINERVYSEFEVEKLGIKFKGENKATLAGCTGSLAETLEQKKVTKKCEGVVVKTVTKGTGTGTLTVTIHAKYDLLTEMLGMNREKYVDGVKAYGQSSVHKPFELTGQVLDEDGVEKLKAYPNCALTKKPEITITNGEEEIAETTLEIAVMPDENGEGMYEAICETGYLEDETIKTSWLENFTTELITKKEEGETA